MKFTTHRNQERLILHMGEIELLYRLYYKLSCGSIKQKTIIVVPNT